MSRTKAEEGPEASHRPAVSWRERLEVQGLGLLLFLFIPLVLYLFVRQPEPLGTSLALGVSLMLGHRFLARPYMARVASRKCLWSNRILGKGEGDGMPLHHRGGSVEVRVLARHAESVRRFFGFVHAWRVLLAIGIFAPLLTLLLSLLLASLGRLPELLELASVTAAFQLIIGLVVNVAANGYLLAGDPDREPRVSFPVHNFFLLGVSNLLWVFRLMGVWWIVRGIEFFFGP